MLAMGPRDLNSAPYSPVHCSSHSMTSFQSSELTELPVVENGQLFAQRAHSARYAPFKRAVSDGHSVLCGLQLYATLRSRSACGTPDTDFVVPVLRACR